MKALYAEPVIDKAMELLVTWYQDGKIQVIDENSITDALNEIGTLSNIEKTELVELILNRLIKTKGEDNENVSD